jgi:MEMO1 family protein
MPIDEALIQKLLARAGLPPKGDQRGQMDTVGYAVNARQMERVAARCQSLAAPDTKRLISQNMWSTETTLTAGICPHDDYWYAGRLYELLLQWIHAKTVIVFGVTHKAGLFGTRNRLVFDEYQTWHGPYGPIAVSPVRETLLNTLPAGDVEVNNDLQMLEHSVEGIVSYMQYHRRDLHILPVLVPPMDWTTLETLSASFASALADIIREKNWTMGSDIAFICSCDAVHYGDSGWGGHNYAPYGIDSAGYLAAVEADMSLAKQTLCGTLDTQKLKRFMYSCIDPENGDRYRMTWCGRFSVPFGLNTVHRLAGELNQVPVKGHMLDYGTSVSEESLDLDDPEGLGTTAPNNFHHFVGYPSIGYV